ncbi:VOC family protein [uncultured Tateyamaria sp.]|uniref:VOC family protein n=1 Tax=uncultured Tateyamaria sp. TaxID=455651 RepID=UPI002637780B|nr:VOC family protein [uncultured Tateyamaria sp.]
MPHDTSGQIVWHDLFSADPQRSMAFFQHVAGWSFAIEHAADFAWGGGQTDFVLAMLANEAGAGFIETPNGMSDGWIAYVEVPKMDSAAEAVEPLGGEIVRPPFDVPGVGRNALIRDPLGALIGISQSQHGFPVPHQQFGLEIYLSGAAAFPAHFYSQIFNWALSPQHHETERIGGVISGPSGTAVARHLPGISPANDRALWVPCIKVVDTADARQAAKAAGACTRSKSTSSNAEECYNLIHDVSGAYFCLSGDE